MRPTSSATATRASRPHSRTARSCSGPRISWSRGWSSARWSSGAQPGIRLHPARVFRPDPRRRGGDRAEPGPLDVVGPNVLGTGQPFELEVFESPGGYICGEQSALIEAIEEHRAEPRNRPPVIEANGLYNKPTLLNNVETFAWVPSIVLNGGAWYRDSGIADSPWYVSRRKPDDKPERWPRGRGMRFFSICGDVARPGVYEVPFGIDRRRADRDGRRACGTDCRCWRWRRRGRRAASLPATLTPADLPAKQRRSFPAGRNELSMLDLPLDQAEFDELGLMLGAGLGRRQVPGSIRPPSMLDLALERHDVLPQRVVRQVRPLPARLAEARPASAERLTQGRPIPASVPRCSTWSRDSRRPWSRPRSAAWAPPRPSRWPHCSSTTGTHDLA